ncbi:MAG: hypothetical protein PHH58_05290 [Rhodoferax sp.]|nr:hypothetical protein [Rhodoferax sp.]
MAVWPSTLPLPRASGYKVKPVDPIVRTEMEAGAPRARRRTTARNDRVSVSWIMQDAQVAIFRAWLDTDCAGGAAWFSTNLALATGGIVPVQARVSNEPVYEHQTALRWLVAAELEVR